MMREDIPRGNEGVFVFVTEASGGVHTGAADPKSIIGGIYKKALIGLAACAGISAFFADWRMPVGVLVAGVLALANLRGMAWGVNAFLGLGSQRAPKRLVLLSYARFLILFIIFGVLMKLHVINPLGVIFGLTVVFAVVLIEGVGVMRIWRKSDTNEPGDFSDEDDDERDPDD